MRISYSWLKKYVKLPDSIAPEEVGEKLKLSTVEVEGVSSKAKGFEEIVVGKVLSIDKHPNADKLQVCSVDVGVENSKPVQIVCGGNNLRPGMLTAVAKIGAKVKWHGEGELIELKPTAIRGVESQGMICGSDEIGLAELFPKKSEKEIVDFGEAKYRVGANVAEALGLDDVLLEIDNKSLSNRPDLWGHYGLAREVAALYNRRVEKYVTKTIADGKGVVIKLEVKESKFCPRYLAVAVSGIKIAESPAWLKNCLTNVGIRPINNIVDITNYVMFDLGQPMHAFDARELAIKTDDLSKLNIEVRKARESEKFKTLDGGEHVLTSEMLVIASKDKTLALAGIMGGLNSQIVAATETVVFESANFDAANVRKTSTALALRTDSSARFEKSLDPNFAPLALAKAVELTLKLIPGAKVASKVVEEKSFRLAVGPIEVPLNIFEKKLGIIIPEKTIVATLEHLGFEITKKKDYLMVKIPSWRATKDISLPEDIVEEVIRLVGYESIPASLPALPIVPPVVNTERALEWGVGEVLVRELAYTEVYNYSFVSKNETDVFGEESEKYLELNNPISKERPWLRRHLYNGLVQNIKNNIDNYQELRLFEIGKVFRVEDPGPRSNSKGDELLPRQDTRFTAVYVNKKNQNPFFEVRRVVELLNLKLNLGLEFKPGGASRTTHHPGRSADLFLGEERVGAVYELHPEICAKAGIKERVGVVKINLTTLSLHTKNGSKIKYQPLPLYPEVERDLAVVVKTKEINAELGAVIKAASTLIKKVELFDVYQGKHLAVGYKSLGYHITLGSPERTLTSSEVDEAVGQVLEKLKQKFGAELRI